MPTQKIFFTCVSAKFRNFAPPFRKSGFTMLPENITYNTSIHIQNFAYKENWKSTAGVIETGIIVI